tara:strand:+ start:2771 stop:3196 length:426 start_codon:yes stop_codon:yes gene_type:complete
MSEDKETLTAQTISPDERSEGMKLIELMENKFTRKILKDKQAKIDELEKKNKAYEQVINGDTQLISEYAADVTRLKDKVKELKPILRALREAGTRLNELGHYGIDFGEGKYECDVAQVAQEYFKSETYLNIKHLLEDKKCP